MSWLTLYNVFILLTECANIINYGNDMLYSTMRNCENNFIKENMFYSHCIKIIAERFSDYWEPVRRVTL